MQDLIDKAARLCGSQNKLAERIGSNSGNLSAAAAGRRRLNPEQIEALARLLDMEPRDVWMAQEEARCPFGRRATTATVSILVTAAAVILAALPNTSIASTGAARSAIERAATLYTLCAI